MMLILGGTSDALNLADELYRICQSLVYSTATEYGDFVASKRLKGKRIYGRKNKEELAELLIKNNIKMLVDATHPFAVNVSENAISVCESLGIEYVRYERPSEISIDDNILFFQSYEEAGRYAEDLKGKILITTGTNDIEKILCKISEKNRVVARVLSVSQSILKLESLGLKAENIIAMKGPFSEEMNYIMFKELDAEILICKDSGISSGYKEKIQAAKRLNMKILVIKRTNITYPSKFDSIEELQKYVINRIKE